MPQLQFVTVFVYLFLIVTVSKGNLTSSSPPSSQCSANDQTNVFLFGLFSGFGISLLTVLFTGLICSLKRRKRRQRDERPKASDFQSEQMYENSLVVTKLDLQSAGASLGGNRSTKELPTVEDKATAMVADKGSVVDDLNDVKSPNDEDEVDNYIELNIHQAEHIYKDLTNIVRTLP